MNRASTDMSYLPMRSSQPSRDFRAQRPALGGRPETPLRVVRLGLQWAHGHRMTLRVDSYHREETKLLVCRITPLWICSANTLMSISIEVRPV